MPPTKPLDVDTLRWCWIAAWRELELTPPKGLYDELCVAYRRTPRTYHTLTHIEDCLRQLEPVRASLAAPAAAELALFFHDSVYQPLAQDNEAKSAAWARRALEEASAPATLVDEVERLVLATAHGATTPSFSADDDAASVLDADLSILGRDARTFDRFEIGVRAEYAVVPDDLYRPGRAGVLRSFLERPAIYLTPPFAERYEAQARENLERTLSSLGAAV